MCAALSAWREEEMEDELKLYPGIIRFFTRRRSRGNNLILLLAGHLRVIGQRVQTFHSG